MRRTVRIALLIIFDLVALLGAWSLGFLCCHLAPADGFRAWWYVLIIDLIIMYLLFVAFGLYNSIWKYAGMEEGLRVVEALFAFTGFNVVLSLVFVMIETVVWAFVTSFLFATFITTLRFLLSYYGRKITRMERTVTRIRKRVMIIGAGDAGAMLIHEMQTSDKLHMEPICILDDDKNKLGQYINGVRVVGKISEVGIYAKIFNIEEIIVAMPSVSEKIKSKIIAECQKTSCKVLIVPGIYQLAEGKISFSAIKEVSIADLLGREPVNVNLDEIMGYIENKVVLVTGGGGSIGSELVRQIAKYNPKQIIIVDIYENNAYDIQLELIRHLPNLNLEVLIGSVRDSQKVDDMFRKYKPQIVFHAAAHKHVPLMEHSPNEAVKNNVSGTFKVADAAGRNGVERFILISTDKAVNPTNIMGATKRICEMIIQTMNNVYPKTNYVAVRFGNVLGSNGSVIPLFKKQIAEGGPVTVTHKEIERFFMTIPEAVSLVLQAGAYAKGGEIFVLDMGNQVKIYDLAINMIRLSGLEPFKDIDIKITGLRPGEKLYEERLMDEEGLTKTANDMISIGKPLVIDEKNLFEKIHTLYVEAYNETEKIKELVHELVPSYKIDNTDKGCSSGTKNKDEVKNSIIPEILHKERQTKTSKIKTKKESTKKKDVEDS